MRVLSNLNGRVTFALPVVGPNVDFPAPDFIVLSMTKATMDFWVTNLHWMKGTDLDEVTGSDSEEYGPMPDHLYKMHGRWYHGNIELESTWQRIWNIENPTFTARDDYSMDYAVTYNGIRFKSETIVIQDIVKASASFYNSSLSILEQLENNAANNGAFGHDYWMCRDEYKVM